MAIAEQVGELQSSNASINDPPRLRRDMAQNGYLYFRGLGPKERVLQLRREILNIISEAGWVDTSVDLMEGKWSGLGPFAENDPEYMQIYKKVVHLPLFNELPADPLFTSVMEKVVDGPVMLHRMHIGRVSFPQNVLQTTPPHQDFHYIRGTGNTYTIWMPVGETPLEVGGLKILRGSHRKGFVEHALIPGQKFAGWGLSEERLPESSVEWLTSGYGLGDFVIFHSHTVHAAMPNVSDRLRISIDNRYQRQGDEFGTAATRTHHDL